MTDDELQVVAEGLEFTEAEVVEGAWVPIPEDEQELGYTRMLAVQVSDPESTEVATLASDDEFGTMLAVDHMARLFFSWGAATEDDTPAGVWRDEMLTSETASTAKGCLG